jgi:hypothetical protein
MKYKVVSKIPTELSNIHKGIIIKNGEGINDLRVRIDRNTFLLHEDSFMLQKNIYIQNGKKYTKIMQSRDFMPTNETHLTIYSNFKRNMQVKGIMVNNKFKVTFNEDTKLNTKTSEDISGI